MAEWVVNAVMEKVMNSFQEYFKDQFNSQTDMPEELQRLREIHPKIKAVVTAYSQAQIQDSHLNEWLWQLRDAIDEADDVLDEIEYRKHEKQVSLNTRKRKAHVLERAIEFGKSIYEIGERAFKGDSNLKRVEEAVQKLDKISAEVGNFLHLLDGKRQEEQQQQADLREARETGAMPTDNLLGRSMEMEFLRQWLSNLDQTEITNTEDFYKNISILSVVGHGGMGKTALLQHVYNDGVTKEFGVKAWVCVSDKFDAKTVITDILESITKERPRLEKLDALQQSLESEVKSKRFLLVLDDIWEDDEEKWKKVLAPLSHGSSGSKILITTRMNSVAFMFAKIIKRSKEPMQLKGLEEDQCLQLLNKHAFASVENLHVHKRLKSITGEMVKKLYGSPLAAKVIGGILGFNLDESYWTKILNTDIHNLNSQNSSQNDLLPILNLSYIYLPKHLQNCFAFCCIFPQDHKIDKDDIVRMWIALGFIHSSNIQGETLEETGGRYFNILMRKSFFDEFELNNSVYYKMHDLMHELAQFVSTQEIFKVMDDKELYVPPTIRHLSIQTNNLEAAFKKMGELKNLRSLFLSFSEEAKYNENFVNALYEIFKAYKNIRLLVVFAPSLKKTPDTINCLIHLRYLKLGPYNTPQLPRSVSNLYYLQFLIYKDALFSDFNDILPSDINNLYNLRYLELPMSENCMIHEIGKLKSLQNLNYFYVKNENGYRIGELEHMNELRQIRIEQLKNIKDAEEASCAKFYDKNNLTDLSLWWGWGYNGDIVIHDLDEKVLDRIEPCKNLRRLLIDRYMGTRSAMWMNDVSFTSSYLEYIKLAFCLKWKSLPPFGQLPFLKSLHLYDMPEVEKLDYNMDCMFPCLTELCLINCSKLQELPSLPTKLQKLKMVNIGWKSCNLLEGIRSCWSIAIGCSLNLISLKGGWQKLKTNENCQLIIDQLTINDPSVLLVQPLRSVSSLRSLTIGKNDEFVQFPIETEQWFLQLCSSLSELRFDGLHSLQFLPSSLERLSSLNTLRVSNAPSLKLLPELPSSLRELEVYDVESLQWLPSSLSTISSLKCLVLKGTLHLKSLPDLPSSLEKLEFEKLESLQCLPSSFPTISSLKHLKLNNIPHLKSLPELPSSLEKLELEKLESLKCLPSSFLTISSLKHIKLNNIPHLKLLPELPSSLEKLELEKLESCQCLPSSLPTVSSLKHLELNNIPLLNSLLDLPSSLENLVLEHLESCQCLPSFLSTISSLKHLKLNNIPQLKSLPDLPSSLESLELEKLESFECLPSSLSTISSLEYIELNNIPYVKSLPNLPSSMEELKLEKLESLQCLPSSLSTISSIKRFNLNNIPHLKSLSDLPSSLEDLVVENLESLQCLSSSLWTHCSLTYLNLKNIPHLKSLPDLPSSLEMLLLKTLQSCECLPSSLSTLSSLRCLYLINIPHLKSLPDLPSSLKCLSLQELENLDCLPELPVSLKYLGIHDCHPQLREHYKNDPRLCGNS